MENNQEGIATTTWALLAFTVVVGIWFFMNNDMNAAKNDLRSIIAEIMSFFK